MDLLGCTWPQLWPSIAPTTSFRHLNKLAMGTAQRSGEWTHEDWGTLLIFSIRAPPESMASCSVAYGHIDHRTLTLQRRLVAVAPGVSKHAEASALTVKFNLQCLTLLTARAAVHQLKERRRELQLASRGSSRAKPSL